MAKTTMVPPRRDGVDRHRRMLVDREFDIAEVSLASYILARQAGVPLTAVPTVPRRLFSQNHIFVNADAGIERPADLVGRRIAIWAKQDSEFYPNATTDLFLHNWMFFHRNECKLQFLSVNVFALVL